jgi:hypothetical protein
MKHVPSSTTAPFPQDPTADVDDRDIGDHELAVLRAIRDTAFGTVEVTVHQSRIVQITRSEKLRL